jgi:hypothetical protein
VAQKIQLSDLIEKLSVGRIIKIFHILCQQQIFESESQVSDLAKPQKSEILVLFSLLSFKITVGSSSQN